MRRRITRAILGVAFLLVVGLGLPLAIVVQRFYEDRAVADLQRRAAETIAEIALPLDQDDLRTVSREADSPGRFSVYDGRAHRVYGPGPADGDAVVVRALRGRAASASIDGDRALAAPITDRNSEEVVGAVRITQSNSVVDHQVERAWLAMTIASALGLAAAAAIARSQSRRLAEPLTDLARHADELGRGEFGARPAASGIDEVDIVAASLVSSGERLAELVARERAFSADVSHQLRTPLTGLRLQLERIAAESASPTDLRRALEEVARLEATVRHLLDLARDRTPVTGIVDLADCLRALDARWAEQFRRAERTLVMENAATHTSARGSDVSIAQVLDVLIDNSLRHARDTVTVRSRDAPGGVVIEVADDGPGLDEASASELFERRSGEGHGIGLALARAIAEADGGRLILVTPQPPCFILVLPAVDD